MPICKHIHRILATLSVLALVAGTRAVYASSWDPTVLVNTESFQIIDDLDGTSDIYIQFGDSLNKKLTYNRGAATFIFDDDLEIIGTASGRHLHAQDLLTVSGSVIFENTTDSTTSFQVRDADGGNPVLNVDTTNEFVGVGTSSPEYTFDVTDASNSWIAKIGNANSSTNLRLANSKIAAYNNDNPSALSLNPSGGSVGIGVSTPTYLLEVAGTTLDAKFTSTTGTNSALMRIVNANELWIGSNGSAAGALGTNSLANAGVLATQGSVPLQFGASGTIWQTIEADGDVGFGTTAPDTDVEIIGVASGTVIHAQATLTSSGALVWEGAASGSTLYVGGSFNGVGLTDCDTAATSKLLWDATTGRFSCGTDQTGGSSGFTGTGALQAFFDNRYVAVQGDTMTGGLLIDVGAGNESNTIDSGLALEVVGTASGEHLHFGRMLSGSGSVRIRNVTDSTTSFQVLDADGGNPVLNVDTTNEFVGVGTSSPDVEFHVNSIDDSYIRIENGQTSVSDGSSYGGIQWEGNDSDTNANGVRAAIYTFAQGTTGGAKIVFKTANSSSLSLPTHMLLDKDGQLGIGLASSDLPQSKLEVVGTMSGTALTVSSLKNCDTIDTDANGVLSCGTDGGSAGFTGTGALQAFFDNRYVETAGDTMTGALTIQPTTENAGALKLVGSGSHALVSASGGSILHTARGNNELVGGVKNASTLNAPYGLAVAGRYAYVANYSDTSLRVIDITDPTSPSIIGGLQDASSLNGAISVAVSGKYAYVVANVDDSMQIIDISRPTNPVIVGEVQDSTNLDGPYSVAVAGRYAYIPNYTDASLRIIDISDPTNPSIVGGVKDATNLAGATSVAVAGRYAYVTSSTDNALQIIDISDPTNPSIVGEVDDNTNLSQAWDVAVSGRYAYVVNYNDDSLRIIDISNPASASIVGGVKDASLLNAAHTIDVNGRYAYVGNLNDSSLRIIDVSDPTNPVIVGGIKDTTNLNGIRNISVVGRYAYVINTVDDSLRVVDLNGFETPSAYIGAIEAGRIFVQTHGIFGGDVTINGSLSVGEGGLSVQGQSKITSASGTTLTIQSLNPGSHPSLNVVGTASGTVIHAQDTLTSSGTLVWEGAASGATLYLGGSFNGVGLTDCDTAATSKLLWDATTGQFSCGTDQTGGSSGFTGTGALQTYFDNRYVAVQGDTMTGGLLIDVGAGNESNTIDTGLALEVVGTASGEILHAQRLFTSSGAAIFEYDGGALDQPTILATALGSRSAAKFLRTVSADDLSDPLVDISQENSSTEIDALRVTHAGIGPLTKFISSNTAFANDLLTLSAAEEDTGSFNFFKLISDNDGTPDTELTINQDGDIATDGKVGVGVGGGMIPETELEVVGTASGRIVRAQDTLSSSGTLVWEGAASGATLYVGGSFTGVGLTDCDTAATSKLLWDATTGRFSCGTDQDSGGGAWSGTGALQTFFDNRYVAVQGDTMTGGLLIDVGAGNESNTIDTGLALEVVGTASGEHLHFGRMLSGSGSVRIRNVTDSTTSFQVLDADGGNPVFNIDTTNERVGIGNNAPSFPLDVTGDIRATGDIYVGDQIIRNTDTNTFIQFTSEDLIDIYAGGSLFLKFFESATDYLEGNTNRSDIDFYWHGDTNFYTFAVDAANERVGVGTGTPDTKLEVVGTASGAALFGYDINNSKAANTGSILISRTAGQPEWAAPTGAMTWYLDGTISTGTSQSATVIMPFGMTVTDVDLVAKTAPTGQSLIVDINEEGTTLFSTRPEIDASATREDGNHVFSDTTLAAGSAITIDIDQVGSGTAGANLTIMLKGTRHY